MKILVPVDGSKSSNKSVEVAKEIGKKFEAELLIMTVVPETSIFEQYPTNFPYTLEVNKANTERAEYVLKEVEEVLKKDKISIAAMKMRKKNSGKIDMDIEAVFPAGYEKVEVLNKISELKGVSIIDI